MDWTKLQAALIRAFWSIVFPLIGAGVVWLQDADNLNEIGVTNGGATVVIGAVLYGLKKYLFPDTKI
ncbi:MAG: hypothetical protein WC322_05675 [Candidatus Paceibacterota bacterium]|jgi:hypothetical protein